MIKKKSRKTSEIILDIMQVILTNQGILKSNLLTKANISDIETLRQYIAPYLEQGFIQVELKPNKKKTFEREYYYLSENGINLYRNLISLA